MKEEISRIESARVFEKTEYAASRKAGETKPKEPPTESLKDGSCLSQETTLENGKQAVSREKHPPDSLRDFFRKSIGTMKKNMTAAVAQGNMESARAAEENNEGAHNGGSLHMATYNVAGGNEEMRENFKDETSDHLARQVVQGNLDAVALQEVSHRENGMDYNMELLKDVFRESLPPGLRDGEINYYSVDDRGNPVLDGNGSPKYDPSSSNVVYEATGHNGEKKTMTLTRESLDRRGRPVVNGNGEPVYHQGLEAPLTVYTARLENGDSYSMVYGNSKASNKDPDKRGPGEYGNSVLLGPGREIPRDEKGAIIPGSVEYKVLGHDPSDGEARTAVGVTFAGEGGQRGTVVSAHLTADSDASADETREAQRAQYRALSELSGRRGGNVIIGGDFNSTPGRDGAPSAEDLGLEQADPAARIDHVLVSRDAEAGQARVVHGGGSDHEMIVTDVQL
ncbi:MAG: endonuclease/exonuclease/phosphatase family protein [Candidatus Eremiobacteraeota bacterium]|nr:endonuclease/exonuclease/phosphatase family protein [Candidatus Eremiobacteraeota bacterium]